MVNFLSQATKMVTEKLQHALLHCKRGGEQRIIGLSCFCAPVQKLRRCVKMIGIKISMEGKHMKKLMASVLAAAMVLSLAACGSTASTSSTAASEATSESASGEATGTSAATLNTDTTTLYINLATWTPPSTPPLTAPVWLSTPSPACCATTPKASWSPMWPPRCLRCLRTA